MSLDPVTSADRGWWRTSRRRVFYDAHTPDWTDPHQRGHAPDPSFPVLRDARPDDDIAVMAAAGADSVVLFAKCQYGNAYYPSAVGRPHAGLDGRDLFGRQLAAAHRNGLRGIAYFSNMWDTAAAGAHPEWRLEPLITPSDGGRWPALCLRSGYRAYALAQVREIAERYPVDGLWSDILTAGPCACERCRALFQTEYGHPMPRTPREEGWLDLIRFSQRTIREYLDEQRAILDELRPDAALIPNFYATTFVDAVSGLTNAHLDVADIGSSEGYTDWHGLGFPSYAASYIGSAVLGRPHEVLVSRFVHTWDFTTRSIAQLRFEAFTVAAHGAAVSVDDQPSGTGAISAEVYRRLAPVFDRIAERQPWTVDVEPVSWAALWSSQSARDLDSLLGGPEAPTQGEQSARFPRSEPHPGPSDVIAAVTGTYRALVESHLPVALVDERPEWLQRLPEFRVVLLPDVLHLSRPAIDALRDFVRAGGGLVLTGATAVRDEDGRPAPSVAMEELLGVRFGAPPPFSYPYLRGAEMLAEEVGPDPLPHYGRIPALELLAEDVVPLVYRTDPVLETDADTYWHNNQPAPGPSTDEPVIVERRVGAGRIIVSAARLGNNHARLGHAAYRALLAALVRRAAGVDPIVELIDGPRSTELVVSRQGQHLVAHLVTGAPVARLGVVGAPQPAAVEDVAAIPELRLRVPSTTTSVARVVDGVLVDLDVRDGTVVVTGADDWETVILRGAGA